MKKALYIYSYRPQPDYEEIDHDWFVGDDFEDYGQQETVVAKYMVENDIAEDNIEATKKLESVYKQDTKVLIKQLKGN